MRSRPLGTRFLFANDGEARHVVGVVLDFLGDDLELILHGRLARRDGGRSWFVAGQLGRGRGAGHFNRAGLRHVAGQPVPTLRERLGLE